jgi:hypothetical protein
MDVMLKAGFAGLAIFSSGCAARPSAQDAELAAAIEAERNDPFILMISAERYVVLIGLAQDGAGTPSHDENATDMARATRATLEAARELYRLRDTVCGTDLITDEACGPLPPPAWLGASPLEVADADEINRRLEWLEGAMGPFLAAGCGAGDARQGPDDPPFCSVE